MTTNYQYSSSNREKLQLPIQIKLSEKASSFCEIFCPFFESTLNLQCSQTKGSLESQVFLKLLTLIDCLFNCVTGLVSETRFGVKQLKSLKNSSNLQKGTFILLFHHSEPKAVRKSYFSSDLRFCVWLITRWLPTMSFLVVIERIWSYQFKSSYLKNNQFFAAFCFTLRNLH